MTIPLVTIIIPCYNAELYVADAIRSALGQSYTNVEVIVIDDGSTDDSVKIIRSFGDAIRWETGPNRGACAARNRGLALARGDLVQFLDADDLLDEAKLERQVPHAVAQWPLIICCKWKSEVMAEGAGHLYCSGATHSDSVILALQKVISTPAPLYPKCLLDGIGGWNESLPCAQDYDLNLRLACAGASFHQLPDSLVTVRRLPGSVSNDSSRVLDQFLEICWCAYRQLRERGDLSDERAAAFAAAVASHGRAYLRHGLIARARERFRAALEMHPSGGLDGAYQPWARNLRRLLGPVVTEWLVQVKRRMVRRG
jgi:glycosyltransferase involved in cell wall biosynthesis